MADPKMGEPNALDRMILAVAPKWGLQRVRARAAAGMVRNYEAANSGRRTSSWMRGGTDANEAAGPSLAILRGLARDLTRNNPWARRGLSLIANNTVGWGITPKAQSANEKTIAELWKKWAESTQCDADGRCTFSGLERLVMTTVPEAGEILVRRRLRQSKDGLAVPLQIQLLEPDFIDTTKTGMKGQAGGPIVQGKEFDAIGRCVAYWLYEQHPGAGLTASLSSRRVPASEIAHIYRIDRPGQVRGVSWFAPVLLRMRDLDEYEDARLMQQKIAACFAAFVTDYEGAGTPLGSVTVNEPTVDTLEPGMIEYLPPGKQVSFANPPASGDHGPFVNVSLRSIASGLGVTYEDLANDYAGLPFSAARMSRLAHYANVNEWRWNMLIPQFCDVVWRWFIEAAQLGAKSDVGLEVPAATWTPPPMPMIEPDKEGPAMNRLVRTGAMTPDEMVRERGGDPETHWDEYKKRVEWFRQNNLWLDCDVSRVSQAGLTQERAGVGGEGEEGAAAGGAKKPPAAKAKDETEDETEDEE